MHVGPKIAQIFDFVYKFNPLQIGILEVIHITDYVYF